MAASSRAESVAGFPDFEDELSDYEDFLTTLTDVIESEAKEETCSLCVCGLPTLEKLIICREPSCAIKYFHEDCVGSVDIHRDWFCDNCKSIHVGLPSESSTQIGNVQPTSNQQTTVASTCLSSEPETHLSPEDDQEVSVDVQAQGEVSATTNPSTSTAQSGGMKYPKRRYGKNDAASRAEDYAKTAVNLVFSSPLFELRTPLVSKVKQLASCLLDCIEKPEATAFFKKLTAKLWKKVASVVRGQAWTEECKGQMWREFQSLRTRHKLPNLWKAFLDNENIQREHEEEVFLFQYLLEQIFRQLLHEMMAKDMPTQVQPAGDVAIEGNEEQALRYCCGYIPAKLIKRYKHIRNNQTAAAFVEVLKSWGDTSEKDAPTFVAYTKDWLEKQSRGGLFVVKEDVYNFFKAMELIVRASLRQDNIALFRDLSLQTALLNNICESEEVTQKWEQISGPLSPERRERLFELVVKSFLKMRCNAFVKVYIMIRKQKEYNISKKGERSLRKELSK